MDLSTHSTRCPRPLSASRSRTPRPFLSRSTCYLDESYTGYLTGSMAHAYETGGLKRLHSRCSANIRKRLPIHPGGFNLGMLMSSGRGLGLVCTLQGPRPAEGRRPCSRLSYAAEGPLKRPSACDWVLTGAQFGEDSMACTA